jgi:hypothetical protein
MNDRRRPAAPSEPPAKATTSSMHDLADNQVGTVCDPGPTRSRASQIQMGERFDALVDIVVDAAPTGVRFVYYRAVSKGIVPKTDNGYKQVQRALMALRASGRISWSDIVDSSRWMRKPETWGSLDEMLFDASASYRRDLWRSSDSRVEVWCESESVAGVIGPVTFEWDVPLFPIKGQTSAAFAYAAAMQYRGDDRPIVIYYVGDRDPAGLEIEANLAAKLREYSGRSDIKVTRLACKDQQVLAMQLVGTTPKKKTWRHPTFGIMPFDGMAVEVEAIDAPVLRSLVATAIEGHIDPRKLELTRSVEASERDVLRSLIGGVR